MDASHPHLTDEQYKSQKAAVWKATIILGIATILEVGVAILWPDGWSRTLLNLLFILMSALKAFFIMGEFMHLRYEVRALTISILTPFLFLIWAIIAFLMEGTSWLNYRAIWE